MQQHNTNSLLHGVFLSCHEFLMNVREHFDDQVLGHITAAVQSDHARARRQQMLLVGTKDIGALDRLGDCIVADDKLCVPPFAVVHNMMKARDNIDDAKDALLKVQHVVKEPDAVQKERLRLQVVPAWLCISFALERQHLRLNNAHATTLHHYYYWGLLHEHEEVLETLVLHCHASDLILNELKLLLHGVVGKCLRSEVRVENIQQRLVLEHLHDISDCVS